MNECLSAISRREIDRYDNPPCNLFRMRLLLSSRHFSQQMKEPVWCFHVHIPCCLVSQRSYEDNIGIDILVCSECISKMTWSDSVPVQVGIAKHYNEVLVSLLVRYVLDRILSSLQRVISTDAKLCVCVERLQCRDPKYRGNVETAKWMELNFKNKRISLLHSPWQHPTYPCYFLVVFQLWLSQNCSLLQNDQLYHTENVYPCVIDYFSFSKILERKNYFDTFKNTFILCSYPSSPSITMTIASISRSNRPS